MKKISLKKIYPVVKNKYFIATFAFILWLTFFDRNDFFSVYSYRSQLKQFNKEKQFYIDELQKSQAELHQLVSNSKSLEQYAREKYFMKKDNEDVFVFVKEDSKDRKE